MRAPAALLALAAALALSGCAGTHSPMDPETAEPDDYEVPLLLLGIAVLVGVVLLAVNLSSQGGPKPPPPAQEPAAQETWQMAEDADASVPAAAPAPTPAPRKAAKPRKTARRRAP